MIYQGKEVEILGEKSIFGEDIAWIKIQETSEFLQVSLQDLESAKESFSLPQLRFISIAAKIKDEIAQKNILAPYVSSLIPLPHQILVLVNERVFTLSYLIIVGLEGLEPPTNRL